jgi:hypothetical protein
MAVMGSRKKLMTIHSMLPHYTGEGTGIC